MSQTNGNNILTALSDSMASAVEKAGAATVLVDGRRRMPASGIAYAADLILTADHTIEREDDIPVLLPDGSQVSASLAMLELKGRARQVGGMQYVRAREAPAEYRVE